MANRRGNPTWGRPSGFLLQSAAVKQLETEFEKVTRELGLAPEQYKTSPALRRWVKRNRNVRYVPEALLAHWGLEVDESLGSIAAI